MDQIINLLFFHYVLLPFDRATFPAGYEYYNGSEREYRVEYRWESDSRIAMTYRSDEDGKERKSLIFLDSGFRVIADSVLGPDGIPTRGGRYEFQDGKPLVYRSTSQDAYFFYSGANLDSVAMKKGDTLVEFYTHEYDAQGRLIQTDHNYDKDGDIALEQNRSRITYFLPDSIVIQYAFVPADRDSGRKSIFLSNGHPTRMDEIEYYSGSKYLHSHIWAFPSQVSIWRRNTGVSTALVWTGNASQGIDILGRRHQVGPAIPGRRPAR